MAAFLVFRGVAWAIGWGDLLHGVGGHWFLRQVRVTKCGTRVGIGRSGRHQPVPTMNIRHAISLVLLSVVATTASASTTEPVTACVDLGPSQDIVRKGSGQQIFLRDGDAHYRIAFARGCTSVSMTSSIDISTDGQQNRLCPAGSTVRTKEERCAVSAVERISAEEFAKHKKRAAR